MDLNSKTLITLCSLAVLLISSVYIISTADSSSADENTPSLYDIAPSAGGSGTYDSPAETYSGTYIVDNVDKTLYVFNNSVFDLYIAGDADPWVIYMYKVANNAQSYNAGSQSANGLTVSYDSVQIHITGTPDNGSTTRIELRLEAPELGGDYDTSVITIVCVPTIVFNDLVVGEYWEYNIESEYYNNDLGDVAAGVTWGGIPDGLSINGNMISGTPTTALSGWHTSIWTEGTDPSNGGRVEGRLFANWYVTDVDLAISGEEESWLIATIGYTWSSSATKSCELSVSGMPTGSTATQQNSDIFFVIPTPGDYNLTVTATSGSASVSQTLTFHVKSQLLSASSPTDGSVSLYSEVSLTVSGTGGAVSGQGSYLIGSYADVTATPLAGWMFVGWYDGDKVMSTDADYTFLVSGDIDLSAVFAQYYEVYTSVQGEGIIDGGGKYVLDTNAALEAVPAHGYKLARWIVDGVDSSNTNPLIVDSSVTVVAVFEPREFTVTATVIGNGSVSGTGSVVHGGSIQLTAIADPGNTFWMWVLDGVESTESTLTITNIADDVVVTAKFHPDTVCVTTVIDSALGTCSPSSTVAWGGDVTLSATATTSRAFAGWYVDGVLTSTSPLTTITTITKDIVCEARFEADLCDVTITTDCVGGTILVDGVETDSVQKPRGSTISLSASSDAGYTFSGWYVGSSKVSSSPTASVTITETTVIKAVWTYSKNVSINADSLPVAPFNLHPTLSSDAGVKSVSWRLSSDDGYSRTSNGTSPSLYVRTWGDYTVTATVTFVAGTTKTVPPPFEVTKLTKTYTWRFQANPDTSSRVNETYGSFSYTFDRSWYEHYLDKEGPSKLTENNLYLMGGHVTFDDDVIEDFAEKLENYVKSKGCSDYYARASAILKFVQSFDYAYDDDQFGEAEYYMYPATFLIKEKGDCEDHAFLYAAIMKALGHKVILLSGQGHCAVGLDIDASGTYYRYVSLVKYYYCETTATSAAGSTNYGYQDYGEIGDMSSEYNVYKFIPVPIL